MDHWNGPGAVGTDNSGALWRALTLDSGSAVVVITDGLRISFANAAAAHLIGRPLGEIEGSHLRDVFPPEAASDWETTVSAVLREGAALVRFKWMAGVLHRKTVRAMPGVGGGRWVLCVCQPNPVDHPLEGECGGLVGLEGSDWSGPLSRLTSRELIVLAMIGAGLRNQEIATRLDRSTRTVDGHCNAIFRKLGLNSRTQLAALAIRVGLVNPHGEMMIDFPGRGAPVDGPGDGAVEAEAREQRSAPAPEGLQ